MSYDRNNLKETTEDGINDLVNDVIGGVVSLDKAFTEIKFIPLQKKISKALELKDDEDWVKASTENSVESYSKYLSSYNRGKSWYIGKHVDEAKSILSRLSKSIEDIDEESWNIASTTDTKESYQSYLSTYDKTAPEYIGKYVNDAKSALNTIALREQDEDDWQSALTQNTEDVYKAYLSKYNNAEEGYVGLHVSDASNAIESLQKAKQDKEQADRKISECKLAWEEVRSLNNVQAYQDFISKYDSCAFDEVQALVVQAKNQILSILDDEDWKLALKTNTQKGYDRYIVKYEPLKSEYQGKYLDQARSWIPGRPNPRPKFIAILCASVLVLAGILIGKVLTKEENPIPLTDEEVTQILAEYTDSLKQDLFDGFYLAPMSVSDARSTNETANEVKSTIDESDNKIDNGLYSREDVINRFMLNNGKFIVKNRNGETIKLPETDNGIDSICVKDSPFFEYIDNNGLRRVVALYKDNIYFYLGDCGKNINGMSRHILCNNDDKLGIIDEIGQSVLDFKYYAIESVEPNNYACKLNAEAEWIYFSEDGKELEIKADFPTDTKITKSGLIRIFNPNCSYYDDNKYGYQDLRGNIVIPYQFESAGHFSENGFAAVGKGKKITNKLWMASAEKYGVIDIHGRIVLPFEYDYIYIGSSDTIIVAKNGLYGMMSLSTQEIVLPFKYEDCSMWNRGYCVKENNRYSFINSSGNRIVPNSYDYAEGGQTPTRVRNGRNWYYINDKGENVMGPFDDATWFDTLGLACVSKNGKSGFINKEGHVIIPFIYDSQNRPPFKGTTQLAQVVYNGHVWYINKNGAFAYPLKGKPTDQNISQQIQESKVGGERQRQEREEKENNKSSSSDRSSNTKRSKKV